MNMPTPRTDTASIACDDNRFTKAEVVPAGFARTLEREVEELKRDKDYLTWRLKTCIPLLQEARDALPAITTTAARLHGVSLTLSDRMDAAGTATRKDFDAAIKEDK